MINFTIKLLIWCRLKVNQKNKIIFQKYKKTFQRSFLKMQIETWNQFLAKNFGKIISDLLLI